MYAIIRSGSRQYQVRAESVIAVNRLALDTGAAFETSEVLMLDGDGAGVQIGTPFVSGALVRGRVLAHFRDRKVLIFKHKRRKNYRRTRGHRQELTRLRIEAIELGGKTLAEAKALPVKAAKVPRKAAEAEQPEQAGKGAAAAPAAKAGKAAAGKSKAAPKAKAPAKAAAKKPAAKSAPKAAKKPAAKAAAKPAAKAKAAKPATGKGRSGGGKGTGKSKSSKD